MYAFGGDSIENEVCIFDVIPASSSPRGSTSLEKQFKFLIINGRAPKVELPVAVGMRDGMTCDIVVQGSPGESRSSVTEHTSHLKPEFWYSLKINVCLLQTKSENR